MKNHLFLGIATLSALSCLATPHLGFADPLVPTITVTASVGPTDSSAYTDTYRTNAATGLLTGASSVGTPTTPDYFSTIPLNAAFTGITGAYNLLSTPNAYTWKGDASPGTDYGPTFATEHGNQLFFGVKLDDNNKGSSAMLTLANVAGTIGYNTPTAGTGSFAAAIPTTFNDVNAFGYDYTATPGVYTPVAVGGTTADIIILPGNWIAWEADETDPNAAIADAITGTIPGMYSANYVYTGTPASSSAFIDTNSTVPEPGSMLLLALGTAGVVVRRKFRRS